MAADPDSAALRADWQAFSWPRVDADLDFVGELVAATPQALRPCVISVPGASGPGAMVVGRIEDTRLVTSVGYRPLLRPRVRMLTVAPGGIAADDAHAPAAIDAILDLLGRGEADVAVLPALRDGSELLRAARSLPSPLGRDRIVETRTHRRLELPSSYDEFLRGRSRSTREGIKRYAKKLEREFEGRLSFSIYREPGEIDELFAAVDPIAAKTYQAGLGVALRDDPRNRRLVSFGLERGWFRVWVLSLDGVPVAFWPGWLYDRSFYIGTPGYEPELADYRLGQYVLMRLIADLCIDSGIDVCDFGGGDGEYKRRFSSESWEETEVLIFAPTLKGAWLNVSRTAVAASARALRWGVVRLGVEEKLKQAWRRRLAT
jgi:Acetyltransferase (GNAT) domain